MLFPLADDDSKISGPSYVTWTLIALNVILFLYQSVNPDFTNGWSMIPKEITTGQDLVASEYLEVDNQLFEVPQEPGPPIIYLTLLSSMFMHGGLMHIGGNMLYLWIFGDNVEHRFGHFWFLIFYLVSGFVASISQIAINPDGVIPNLGASGAIFGVLGGYLVLFPRNRVKTVVMYYVVSLPAIAVIGLWAGMQLFFTYGTIMSTDQSTGGVAYAAHLGGMVAGALIGLVARSVLKEEPDSMIYRVDSRDPSSKRWW